MYTFENLQTLQAQSLKMQSWIRKQTYSPELEKTLRRFYEGSLQAEEEWWPPAMAVALGDDALEDVLRRIRLRELPPLMIEWSPLFDL